MSNIRLAVVEHPSRMGNNEIMLGRGSEQPGPSITGRQTYRLRPTKALWEWNNIQAYSRVKGSL